MAPFWPLGLNITTNLTISAVPSHNVVIDFGLLRNIFYINESPGAVITLSGFTMVSCFERDMPSGNCTGVATWIIPGPLYVSICLLKHLRWHAACQSLTHTGKFAHIFCPSNSWLWRQFWPEHIRQTRSRGHWSSNVVYQQGLSWRRVCKSSNSNPIALIHINTCV